MSTVVNQAITAIMAALQSAPAVAPQIGRVSLRPIAQAATQAVVVRPVALEAMQAGDFSAHPTSWASTIAVECYARSAGATAPDVGVDALAAAVYARLMADTTLGGTVIALHPQQLGYDFDADGDKTACATFVFTAQHRATDGFLT